MRTSRPVFAVVYVQREVSYIGRRALRTCVYAAGHTR